MESRPSLWNLCRVIASKPRLELLRILFENGELCVSDVQIRSGMSRTNTSNQLKALHTCGLISFRRENMRVVYRAEPVFPDSLAAQLVEAIRECFSQSVPLEEMIRIATGFSHGRRIEVVRAIGNQSEPFEVLQRRTRMSRAALFRHVDKLERRDFMYRSADAYKLGSPTNVFARVLLNAALK